MKVALFAVALLLGIGVWALEENQEKCPMHWHASFAVYVDGHRLHFNHPVFHETPSGVHDYHMHADDQIMHFHPQLRNKCVPLDAFLSQLGVSVEPGAVQLNKYFGGNQGTYAAGTQAPDGSQRSMEVWTAHHGGQWQLVRWQDIASGSPQPGDRFLITVGALDEASVQAQLEAVRVVPDHYLPPEMRA